MIDEKERLLSESKEYVSLLHSENNSYTYEQMIYAYMEGKKSVLNFLWKSERKRYWKRQTRFFKNLDKTRESIVRNLAKVIRGLDEI